MTNFVPYNPIQSRFQMRNAFQLIPAVDRANPLQPRDATLSNLANTSPNNLGLSETCQ
jgi:hypothetical protein